MNSVMILKYVVKKMLMPKLNKAEMWADDTEKHYIIYGEIWSTVGLFLHTIIKSKKRYWIISHYKSGRRVLKYIPTKEMALKYMARLRKVADWNMVLPELRREQKRISAEMDKLQREINKG